MTFWLKRGSDWNIRLCSLVPFEGSSHQNLPETDEPKPELNRKVGKAASGKSSTKRSPTPKPSDKLDTLIPKAKDRSYDEVELFTDPCKATVKLEFSVDFAKPMKGKYSTTEVLFIPTALINRVLPEKAQKSFRNAMKSRKKENRKQVLAISASDLVSLVKAMQYWPHPESSGLDRQELYKHIAQSESVIIYSLSGITDAIDIK
jgi:hypothetical protein